MNDLGEPVTEITSQEIARTIGMLTCDYILSYARGFNGSPEATRQITAIASDSGFDISRSGNNYALEDRGNSDPDIEIEMPFDYIRRVESVRQAIDLDDGEIERSQGIQEPPAKKQRVNGEETYEEDLPSIEVAYLLKRFAFIIGGKDIKKATEIYHRLLERIDPKLREHGSVREVIKQLVLEELGDITLEPDKEHNHHELV